MRILFFSHYFPPEVNAPALRTFEHCREWVASGHEVHVVTCIPSHPAGVPFPGYRSRWYQREEVEGIQVHRVWTYLAPNKGSIRRILNYLSYVPSAVFRTLSLGDFDVVIATSPQFFCAVAGWLAAGVLRAPWVFELRDIWPESISAVGAMSLSPVLRFLEALELRMYASAQAVVCLTRSFVENLARRGIPREKLHFIPNGIEPEAWANFPSGSRDKFGLNPSDFVCGYVGTIGMAHGLRTVLEAAKGLQRDRPEIKFLLAGDGAERARLAQLAQSWGLSNVIFAGLVPHDLAQSLLLESDVALVLLKKSDLFETVIPSKLLEALAAGRPVILGVAGEARQILQEANAGIPIDPEDAIGLRAAVETLAGSPELRRQLGENGRAYVSSRFDRKSWSRAFLDVLAHLAGRGVLVRTAGM